MTKTPRVGTPVVRLQSRAALWLTMISLFLGSCSEYLAEREARQNADDEARQFLANNGVRGECPVGQAGHAIPFRSSNDVRPLIVTGNYKVAICVFEHAQPNAFAPQLAKAGYNLPIAVNTPAPIRFIGFSGYTFKERDLGTPTGSYGERRYNVYTHTGLANAVNISDGLRSVFVVVMPAASIPYSQERCAPFFGPNATSEYYPEDEPPLERCYRYFPSQFDKVEAQIKKRIAHLNTMISDEQDRTTITYSGNGVVQGWNDY